MTYKNTLMMTLAAVTLLGFAPMARAADPDSNEFVKNAAIGDMFEVQTSKLALTKSTDPQIQKFAQQMIKDHTMSSTKMKATLASIKYPMAVVRKKLDQPHQEMLDGLKAASGTDFNHGYVNAQVKAHDEAVTVFSNYSDDGKNPTLKAFADKTLPTLKMHQEHVKMLAQ